ncbi:sugar phosphate nucleotidyltransferase [Terasakiella sp. A23]|uniref:sugar phosphate nucleotidyltransferase n=1 Tax=Terasakiella sp. FCG-A23 TaxID=3080561 RepID=UPI002954889E|nr:sugar phosphate nucleotidyltransferase [Terasakiella sp. A23]MDV7341109.1 sugar phosphate nucleotidyltransferase [Terasakiella sp. A23]
MPMICIRPVLWAGSEGSRPHPLSTSESPLQFTSILEGDSPFQDTLERVSDPEFLPPLIITTPSLKKIVEDQCHEIAYDYEDLILLEEDAQSAAALKAAAVWSKEHGEDFPIFFTPCDHFIADQGAFMRAVTEAAYTAQQGYLVSFGVVAEGVQTAYSYIEVGDRLDTGYAGHSVRQFVETPDVEAVQALLEKGRTVWHAGLVCATPDMVNAHLKSEQTVEAALLAENDKLCVVSLLTAWADLKTWPGIWKTLSLAAL